MAIRPRRLPFTMSLGIRQLKTLERGWNSVTITKGGLLADYLLCTIREGRVGSRTTVMGSTKINLQEKSQFIGVRGSLFY